MDALELRCHRAGHTMSALCRKAGIYKQTWFRAKGAGQISEAIYRRLDFVLQSLEVSA